MSDDLKDLLRSICRNAILDDSEDYKDFRVKDPAVPQFVRDCIKFRGRILTDKWAHCCIDWGWVTG